MEENIQDYISICFDIKPPNNVTDSIINTIVLRLRDIVNMEQQREWDNTDTVLFNDKIDRMIKELENLKIIKLL